MQFNIPNFSGFVLGPLPRSTALVPVALVFRARAVSFRGGPSEQVFEEWFEAGDGGGQDGGAYLDSGPERRTSCQPSDFRALGKCTHHIVRSELSNRKSPCLP